jgi:hypothetical protein
VREVCGNVACVRDRDAGQVAQLNFTERLGLRNARQEQQEQQRRCAASCMQQ